MTYGARTEGTGVVMHIGGNEITMGYEEALTLASYLRGAGKEAKRNAGDHSRSWRVFGRLTDALAEHKPINY